MNFAVSESTYFSSARDYNENIFGDINLRINADRVKADQNGHCAAMNDNKWTAACDAEEDRSFIYSHRAISAKMDIASCNCNLLDCVLTCNPSCDCAFDRRTVTQFYELAVDDLNRAKLLCSDTSSGHLNQAMNGKEG